MARQCKICGRDVTPRHTIRNITYYYCPHCDFLQNFHWEDHPNSPQQQTDANDIARADRWPAGDPSAMYEGAWRMLEYITSPIAWASRRLHTASQRIPGYTALTRALAKRRLHRILDFGCGHGVGVLELRARDGLDAIGLDPYSPTVSPYIIRQTIHAAAFAPNSFDGIISTETMEHISDILPTFAALHKILRPGGTLVIQTRRTEDPDYQREGEKWFYLKDPTTHVSIYSHQALAAIAAHVGFRAVEIRDIRTARFRK